MFKYTLDSARSILLLLFTPYSLFITQSFAITKSMQDEVFFIQPYGHFPLQSLVQSEGILKMRSKSHCAVYHHIKSVSHQPKVGMTLSQDDVDMSEYIHTPSEMNLSQPSPYQQWLKVKNHYVLINVITYTVVKVVAVK